MRFRLRGADLYRSSPMACPCEYSCPGKLALTQILALMEHHDQIQREGLKHYRAVRHYHVEYRGLANLEAGMEAGDRL